jgi:thiosulfate dehydrogenase [quinone] large subunit
MSILRRSVIPIGAVAALLLVYLVNPWVNPDGDLRQVVTIAFWIASIVLVVALFEDRHAAESSTVEIEGPAFARFLFGNSRAGLLWLPIRIFVGFTWLEAGLHKLGDPGWTQGGAALKGFWTAAVAVPAQGHAAITYEWYRGFLNTLLSAHAEGWFAWVVTLGELAIGVGLILGVLTGIAAFFGAFMNMSFLLAGSASVNPVLFTLAVGLMLAWRVAGYYGVDRVLLPRLGAPWSPGVVVRRGATSPASS